MHVFLYYSQWVSNLTSKIKVNVESAGILVEQKDLPTTSLRIYGMLCDNIYLTVIWHYGLNNFLRDQCKWLLTSLFFQADRPVLRLKVEILNSILEVERKLQNNPLSITFVVGRSPFLISGCPRRVNFPVKGSRITQDIHNFHHVYPFLTTQDRWIHIQASFQRFCCCVLHDHHMIEEEIMWHENRHVFRTHDFEPVNSKQLQNTSWFSLTTKVL